MEAAAIHSGSSRSPSLRTLCMCSTSPTVVPLVRPSSLLRESYEGATEGKQNPYNIFKGNPVFSWIMLIVASSSLEKKTE